MQKEIIVMIGIAGSGKSSYVDAHYTGYQVICADDIRKALGHTFDLKIEPIVHAINEVSIRSKMERGLPIVIDETNTRMSTFLKWTTLAKEYRYRTKAIVMMTSTETCKKRRGCDKGEFPPEVIDRMSSNMNLLLEYENLNQHFDSVEYIEEQNGKQ